MRLFVLDGEVGSRIPVYVDAAATADIRATFAWQTNWSSPYAAKLPNKVALRRADDGELLGLMSYAVDDGMLAVEIIYIESAPTSNANIVRLHDAGKKYTGIAKALFAYAANVSMVAGFDGVLVFKAKTSELVEYYIREFGARHAGAYDPFRLVIWEDAAEALMRPYQEVDNL